MKPANLLLILSDEHSRRLLGCYGHPLIRTPNLDRLASSGLPSCGSDPLSCILYQNGVARLDRSAG